MRPDEALLRERAEAEHLGAAFARLERVCDAGHPHFAALKLAPLEAP
jgi:hypothetical protein